MKHLVIRWALGLIFILGLVAIFTDLTEDIWFREGFTWDAPVILAIHQFSRPWLDTVMRILTQAGEIGAISVALLAAVLFAWKRNYLNTASILISLSGSAALNTLLKFLLKRPRPDLFPPLVVESGFSYPSGHVTASVAVYGFLAVLLWRSHHRGWAIFSAAWVPVVAISRIYLGVHYPSDTLGALVFASLWLVVVYAVHDQYARFSVTKSIETTTQD
jgi:membrane-associated phospholipid phosphatase